MANTFIELNDTPSSYTGSENKWARVNSGGTALQFWDIQLEYVTNVEATGAYLPFDGAALIYNAADAKWRPASTDIYSVGNGIVKAGLVFSANITPNGGLTSNSLGVRLANTAVTAGVYGNSTTVPQITVDATGRITGVTPITLTAGSTSSLNASYVGNTIGTAGQIVVTGGTGINSNATINLVATGVTAGIYGNSTSIPTITVDTYGRVSSVSTTNIILVDSGGNVIVDTGNLATVAFSTIIVSGQANVSAESPADTLTFAAGTGMTITTNSTTDTITLATIPQTISYNSNSYVLTISGSNSSVNLSTLAGGVDESNIPSQTSNAGKFLSTTGTATLWADSCILERFRLNYNATGGLASIDNRSSGISSVTIDSSTGGQVTIIFTGYGYPPGSITCYGYDYTNNKYYIVPLETSMTLREIPGGGSSGSPTVFSGNFTTMKLRLREAETGASRGSFGTTTHAWVQFVMYN